MPSASPSWQRSSSSHPQSTPYSLAPRATDLVGQPMPQLLPHGTTPSSKVNKTPTSSYFAAPIGQPNASPRPSSGVSVRQDCDHASSSIADGSKIESANLNPDFKICDQQSRLGDPVPTSSICPASEPRRQAAASHPIIQAEDTSRPLAQPKEPDEEALSKQGSFFDIPRHRSPASFSSGQSPMIDYRNSRLSLPAHSVHNQPTHASERQAQRAETLPGSKGFSETVLLLDVRVAPQYSTSRIGGALNLCIPTTLLKRPSFNTQKLRGTFAHEADREEFCRWKTCNCIAVYDANSGNLKDAHTAVNVLKKFFVEGWNGRGLILKGGFAEFSYRHPSMIKQGPAHTAGLTTTSSSTLTSPKQTVAPVAGGCPMPIKNPATVPFFNNIRQNMDLLDGVGQLSVSRPTALSYHAEKNLPRWLQQAIAKDDNGKSISEKFLAIEQTEQRRMQGALECPVAYGSPRPDVIGKVQVAGIERGSQNRYNNILPYDHSRVRQQNVPPGDSDYINASHIKASYSQKGYVATQAPIPATFDDFWRLVWEQDVRVIVMLTAELEGGQVKSHPYWHSGNYGPLELKLLSEEGISLELNRMNLRASKSSSSGHSPPADASSADEKISLDGIKRSTPDTPSATVRHFALSHSNLPFEPMREVTQLQYAEWPDFGAPAKPDHLLALIEQTNAYVKASAPSRKQTTVSTKTTLTGQRPVLVHCSAGCGRTGTFCTVDSAVDMLKRQRAADDGEDRMEVESDHSFEGGDWLRGDTVDLVAKAVEDFRGQRLSMVQNLRQFVLCYESVLDWLVRNQGFDEGSSAGQHAGERS